MKKNHAEKKILIFEFLKFGIDNLENIYCETTYHHYNKRIHIFFYNFYIHKTYIIF